MKHTLMLFTALLLAPLAALHADTGAFDFNYSSLPSVAYQIQFSPDLRTWTNAGTTFIATNAATHWSDDGTQTGSLPRNSPKRFYRLQLTP